MTDRNKIQAVQSIKKYTTRNARRLFYGTLGNNAGTVDHATRTDWVYLRLHGDSNQVVEAYAAASFPHVAEIVVDVELVQKKGAPYYQVLGVSAGIAYNDTWTWAGSVGDHAEQHQRRDRDTGGRDPLDVYNRALVNLRARAQTVPDLTLYVERGFYSITAFKEYAGGNSPAFTAPGGAFSTQRWDLLYLGNDDALHILQGTAAPINPAYPTVPANCIPIAYVILSNSSTTITESMITDARTILSSNQATATAHNLLSAVHSDTLTAAVVDGDVIIGNVTPAWSRLAISIPAAGIRNMLSVANGELRPSWKSDSIYSLIDGTRAFTGVVGGVFPVASSDLATKEYVDSSINFVAEYFFNNTASDIGGIYYKMLETPTGEAQSTFVTAGLGAGNDQALTNFATDPAIPGVNTLQSGIYSAHIHAAKTAGTKPVTIHYEIYARTDPGGVETLITTSEDSAALTGAETEYTLHAVLVTDVSIATTTRIIIKWLADVGATGSDATVTLYAEGTTAAHLNVPISTEVLSSVFVRRDGTTALTANWNAGAFTITLGQLIDSGLTASTIIYSDASKQLTSLANAAGLLHNNGAGVLSLSAVVETDLGLTDLTTANASTTAHGFAPKAVDPGSAVLRNILAIDNAESGWASKALFDANQPSSITVASAGSVGISLTAAHRDHVHASPSYWTIDTPGTLTVSTTNNNIANHTHAITTANDSNSAAVILASDANGHLALTVGNTTIFDLTQTGTAGASARFTCYSGGAAVPTTEFLFRASRGTAGSQSALATGDTIIQLAGEGTNASGAFTARKGYVSLLASENWTDSAQGCNFDFATTAIGTVTRAVRMSIYTGVLIGAPTGGDKGAGTINAAADIYKNNSAYNNPDYALEAWANNGMIDRFADRPRAKHYHRLSLDELEQYIRTNYRLPGIADEPMGMFERGDIALEKIEELTTYLIELYREIESLKKRNEGAK